jgi:hypothetical protein
MCGVYVYVRRYGHHSLCFWQPEYSLRGGGGGIYTWVNLVESGGRGTGEVSTFSRGVGGLWH